MRLLTLGAALASLVAALPVHGDELGNAKALRRAGVIESGVGFALNVAGTGLLLGGFFMPSCAFVLGAPEEGACANGSTMGSDTASALFWSGVAFSVAGDVLWIAGLTQWSVGARRVRRLHPASR